MRLFKSQLKELYKEELSQLVRVMEERYGSPLERAVMRKLKKTAKLCAKNRIDILERQSAKPV